jgi:hypothetical protein
MGYIQIYPDISGYIQIHPGYIRMYPGYIQIYPDKSGIYPDVSGYIQIHLGCIRIHPGCIQIYPDISISGYIWIYLDISRIPILGVSNTSIAMATQKTLQSKMGILSSTGRHF